MRSAVFVVFVFAFTASGATSVTLASAAVSSRREVSVFGFTSIVFLSLLLRGKTPRVFSFGVLFVSYYSVLLLRMSCYCDSPLCRWGSVYTKPNANTIISYYHNITEGSCSNYLICY